MCIVEYLNKSNPCSRGVKNIPYLTVSVVSICLANVTGCWEIVSFGVPISSDS